MGDSGFLCSGPPFCFDGLPRGKIMFRLAQYTYYIRKEEGVIVLGKVQGSALFSGDDLFEYFISQKRISLREIRRFVLEGKGTLMAQDGKGRRIPLKYFYLSESESFKKRLKFIFFRFFPKKLLF